MWELDNMNDYIDVILGGDPELLESGGFTYYDDLDDVELYSYEVYEDNAGGLTLFIFDDCGRPVYGHGGYEYNEGDLSHDIEILKNGSDPGYWDGNCEVYTGGCYGSIEVPKSIDDWYTEVCEGCELVADTEGFYPERMGVAASREFGFTGDFEDD